MKSRFFLISILLLAAAQAGEPQKKNVNSYSKLWTDSPFTSKPPPADGPEEINLINDWVLGGVSEVEGGYMVTLFHKKNAGETQVIRPGGTTVSKGDEMEWLERGAAGSFTVDRVQYGKDSWKDTAVFLSVGGKVGSVKFDDKLLTPVVAAAPPAAKPGQPQGKPPVPGATPAPGVRPPRQRVLPPTPKSNQSQTRPSRGR